MALETKMSCLASVVIFSMSVATLNLTKSYFIDVPICYITIGLYGGVLSTILLTALNNLENILFGKNFYAQLLPEVILCVAVTTIAVGSIHRVCGTVCFLSSIACLYFLNAVSQRMYSTSIVPPTTVFKKKRN